MGTYLACGIATKLTITKEQYTREEIIDKMKKEIDLRIYNISEDEEKVYLEMKEEILEKHAVTFIKEQLETIKDKNPHIQESLEEIKKLENKTYNELMEIAEEKKYYAFQFLKGYWICNNVSYIAERLRIYADIICYISNGKIIMECYYDIFDYIRKAIIKSSNNPIKTAAVVSIIG